MCLIILLLSIVLKYSSNRGLCYIYDLSYLLGYLVNNTIAKERSTIEYILFNNILAIVKHNLGSIIIERDIKVAF